MMRTRRDTTGFGGYVVQGTALGVGAFLGAALVTFVLALAAKKLPFVVNILPKPPSGGGQP